MTRKQSTVLRGATLALALAALPFSISSAQAAEYWLMAQPTAVTMPGRAAPIPMWGYAQCTASFASCGAATVPGPALIVPTGEGLTVNLMNGLTEPTSLVIPGQITTMLPVWFEPESPATTYSGARPAGNLTARVRSFTNEAAPGNTAVYTWPTIKPGTYLYQSGTHPQVQVQMGLYGAMTKDAGGANTAYVQGATSIAYDVQATLLYSEIDPALHDAVASGAYATTGPTSTFDYQPKYFLVNGKPYAAGDPPLATVTGGQKMLLRFINAGLKSHVAMVNGSHMQMIAEDGNPYPWLSNPRQQYTALLPAAKTVDALLTAVNPGPGNVTLAIVDRRLDVTNAGAPDGGMMAFVTVTPGPAAPVITSSPLTTGSVGTPYAYQVTATDPNPGDTLGYSLDAAPTGMTIDAGTGLIAWTPAAAGLYGVTVRVTDSTLPIGLFATQTFTVNVASPNSPPVITSAPVTTGTQGVPYSYNVTAADPNAGDTLTYSLDVKPAGMTIAATTGQIAWTPTNAQAISGGNNVTVRVTDQGGLFATQAFAVAVANINDPPVAVADTYTMVQAGTLAIAAPGVLGNDTDPDLNALTALLGTPPAGGGSFALNANGSFTYTPPTAFTGSKTFTYRARDPGGLMSGFATVKINVLANRAPAVANDAFSVPRRTNANPGAFPVVLNVLANDSDPDTSIDPANTINPSTVTISNAPNHGTAVVNANGTISYTPTLNYSGSDTFRYRVRDTRNLQSSAATVSITVQP